MLDMTINKTAFVPGEPLVYEIDINNMSDNTVEQIHLLLRQVGQIQNIKIFKKILNFFYDIVISKVCKIFLKGWHK